MRKQDRIERERQNRPTQQPGPNPQPPQPPDREPVKGGSTDQPVKPPRQPGRLPLPD